MIRRTLLALPGRILAPLLLALMALFAAAANYALQVASFRESVVIDEMNRLTELLGVEQTRIEIQSGFGNVQQVRRLVAGLGLRTGVTHAYLLDANHRVIAALSRTDLGKPLEKVLADEPDVRRTTMLDTVAHRTHAAQINSAPADAALVGHVPIHPDRQLVVRIDLHRPLALRLSTGRNELIREATLILVSAALLGLLFHLLWFRRTTRLTDALAAMGAGRLDTRVTLEGNDELARIGAAFNRMANDLQTRQRDLEQLSGVINRSPVVAIEWQNRPGWPVGFVSDTIAQWGYTRNELLDGNVQYADLIHPDDRQRIEDDVAHHFAHGPDSYQQEYRLRMKDGRWTWIDDRTWLSRNDAGEVTMIHGVLLDITRQKEAEFALLREKQRLETAETHARLGSWEFDSESGLGWWSAEMHALLGSDPARGVPSFEDYLDSIHPADRHAVRKAFETMRHGERPRTAPFRSNPERGPLRWFSPTVHAEADMHGQLVKFFGTLLDITAIKAAEQALRESEARLRTLVDTIPDLIWLKDPDGHYLACNRMFERFFGATENEIVGRTDYDFVERELADFFRENDRRAIKAGGPSVNEEWVTFADDGHRALFETIKAPLRGGAGELLGVLGIARDITAARETRNALERLNATLEARVAERTAQLESANRELESFSYSVSHDLKAPLRGIDGYSQILLEDYRDRLDDDGRLFLANIRKGVAQMHELIEDLLTYSRMERRTLEARALELPALLQSVLDGFRAEIEANGAEITVDNGLDTLSIDRLGLTVVLRNLIGNALKFSRDSKPPHIAIRCAIVDDKVRIEVRDNGIGIDMKYHDRIFEIFQRLHRAEDYPGTGVGLALVRKAVLRMGGRVWAESAPGEGATFHVELPQ